MNSSKERVLKITRGERKLIVEVIVVIDPIDTSTNFQDQISDDYLDIDSSGTNQNILMGDFNFDISQEGSSLKSTLAKFNLISKFNGPTTKDDTQIDVVFADFSRIVPGAYESYFFGS